MDINRYIADNEPLRVISMFQREKPTFDKSFAEVSDELNPKKHKVNNKFYRKDKKIKVPVDGKFDENGEQVYRTETVKRCRVSVPLQKLLVERSVGFLFGIPVVYSTTEGMSNAQEDFFKAFKDVIDSSKTKYKDKEIARTLFSEREVAEIWYFTLDENGKPDQMKVRIASPSRGDSLYPHFDEYDRMDSFMRAYSTTEETESVLHYDIYTKTHLYKFISDNGGIKMDGNPKRHGFNKIPVIYYRQDDSEWETVQNVIERIEDLLSNWGDTNDYFGSPSYFVSGEISGFAEKGEQGRVYTGLNGADMKVLSWDSSPASIQGELANLLNIVFSYTQTPDVSFETMKQLGGNTSGVAIRLMFTDPHMKASCKIETFGEMFDRRINVIKSGLETTKINIPNSEVVSLKISATFTPYYPKNDNEIIQMINASVGGKATISQKDGVRLNPLVSNSENTIKELEEEERKASVAEGVTK